MKNMEIFAPMQRKPSGSRKSNIIMKKSRKELQTTRAHMQKTLLENVSCNVMDQRGNLGSQPTKKFPSKDSNVKRSRTTMVRGLSPLEKVTGALRPTQFKAMADLVRKENNVSSHRYACSSELRGRSNPNQGHVRCALEDRNKKLNSRNGKESLYRIFGKDLSNNPRDQREIKETNYTGQMANCNGEIKNRKRIESLSDEKAKSNVVEHSKADVEASIQSFIREMKKPRRKVMECNAEVSMPFCIEQSCCSKPIDEPTWRGIFKIGQKYVSLVGHLSTKYGEKVWKLSRSLMPIVEVTKISRSKAWPKVWDVSEPNGNNIGLYFFPNEMRPNEELDQLVKEVIENDLVLRAIVGEAEMLIFPSILLPEQYKTFKGKNYLWGVFKPRKHEGVAVAKPLNVSGCCAHEVEKETQHLSAHQYEVQCKEQGQETIGMRNDIPFESQDLPRNNKNTCKAQASSVRGTHDKGFDRKALEEGRQGDALGRGMVEAMDNVTGGATLPANHGEIDRSRGLSSGKVFGFVVGRTPRLLQLIREMEQEGGVVIAMQGETIGAGPWQRNITTYVQ